MSVYNVLDFGAEGDGLRYDASAVQAAIDACNAAGGGRVILPAGKVYRCGVLVMRSNIELHLETGATLQASPDLVDYAMRFAVGALSGGQISDD